MKQSAIVRTKVQKIKALAGSLAVKLAKENKDPMYIKYKRFRDNFMKFKVMIQKKYAKKALPLARKAASR